MSDASLVSLLTHCPRCHQGPILGGLVKMNERCAACGMPFEQETGQNWGSMFVAYLIGGLLALPLFLILLVNRVSPLAAVGIPLAVLIVIAPFNVRLSRLIWTHVMYHMHRGKRA